MYSGSLRFPKLDSHKAKDEDAEKHKQCDDATITPSISCVAPLHCEKQADNTRDEQKGAQQVEATKAFAPCVSFDVLSCLGKQEQNDGDSGAPN